MASGHAARDTDNSLSVPKDASTLEYTMDHNGWHSPIYRQSRPPGGNLHAGTKTWKKPGQIYSIEIEEKEKRREDQNVRTPW